MAETIYQLLDRIETRSEIEVAPDATSLDFLRAIYRDPTQPLLVRMKAAMACLQFEVPKLGVNVSVVGFASALERRMEARGIRPVINASFQKVEVSKETD